MAHLKRLRFGWLAGIAAAAAVLSMGTYDSARAGVLENFEDGDHTGGYVVDAGSVGQVTLTPDNTMNSPSDVGGSWSLRINTNGAFDFGALRWDHGGVNDHLPEWRAGSRLLYDVNVGAFTDFLAGRWTNQDDFGQNNSGPPDTSLHVLADNQWATFSWDFPAEQQSGQTFWIEWFSTNSNGPVEMWIDNIRVVPEPACLGLFAVGGLGMFGLRRRQR
jgi:hypothetical protein